MERKNFQNLVRWLIERLTNTVYEGTEYIPRTGPVIIATNHLSRMDIPLLYNTPVRPEDTSALVTTKYLKYPFFKWFVETAGFIWLDRDTADFSAFKATFELLKAGKIVGISPEGTRSSIHQLLPGKPGTAMIASRMDVPIVPVGIIGSDTGFAKLRALQKPYVIVRYGPSFHLPPIDRSRREESLQEATDEIMCRIAMLMPPGYHGAYRDHPRLKELLARPPDAG